MFGRTLIIGGGEIDLMFCREYLAKCEINTIVCADSGLDIAFQLGLPVNYAMGDFDSVSKEILLQYENQEAEDSQKIRLVRYPAEKDATDMHLVLDWVVDRLPSEILILGATGRRLDHFLANVNILMKPLSYGIPAYIIDPHNRIYLLDHSHIFRREEMFGNYISLIPFTEEVSAVYLRGFKYELEGRNFTLGESIGVSNELAEKKDAALLEFGEGVLIAIESRD
ncbi:MAG: thiamine diphosphokinase [Clostridiaceae bacterium]|nr:thiamine diphosphokinase [Clostridiaceae bacterium]